MAEAVAQKPIREASIRAAALPPYLSQERITRRVEELGQEITRDLGPYLRRDALICVSVLKGAVVFAADLFRQLRLPVEMDFMGASSYGAGTVSRGRVELTQDVSLNLTGRQVLLIEDIVDTGHTVNFLLEHLRSRHPAGVKLCSLLHKPERQEIEVPIDYLGFRIENRFVVGYGLDAGERYRNLPYIAVLPDDPMPAGRA